jgi:hypothetical protein
MRNVNLWLIAGIVVCGGWFAWLVLSPNRYQSLCQVDYWIGGKAELDSCREMRGQLE